MRYFHCGAINHGFNQATLLSFLLIKHINLFQRGSIKIKNNISQVGHWCLQNCTSNNAYHKIYLPQKGNWRVCLTTNGNLLKSSMIVLCVLTWRAVPQKVMDDLEEYYNDSVV